MNSKKILIQIKRELWENKIRFVYAPLVVTALLIVLMGIGFFKFSMSVSEGGLQFKGKGVIGHHSLHEGKLDTQTILAGVEKDGAGIYSMVASGVTSANTSVLSILILFVLLAYAHSCLFDDRKYKDILFWRSLPVSETTNVLVKLGFILIYAPFVVFLLNLVVGIIALIAVTIFFAYHGVNVGHLVESIAHSNAMFIAFNILLANLFAFLLFLPVIGFMMLASAWAKKSPFLFSMVLPVGLIILDKISQEWFSINLRVIDTLTTYFEMCRKALQSFSDYVFNSSQTFIFDANLISGLLLSIFIGTGFIVATIWLRNNRYEI